MERSEPCDRCGDDTRVGSPRFAGRHQGRLEDGTEVFRCGECAALAMAPHEQDSTEGGTDWFTRSIPAVNMRQTW